MAEYYPLLARAVSAQPNASPDTRNGIYERARKALLGQLRAHDPPLPEGDIEREARALEDAIARVEAEQAPVAEPAVEPPLAARIETVAAAAPRPLAREASSAKSLSLAERAKAHRASLAGSAPAKPTEAPKALAVRPNGKDVESTKVAKLPTPEPAARAAIDLRAEKAGAAGAAAPPLFTNRAANGHDDRAPIILAETKPDSRAERAIPRSGMLWKFGRSRAGDEAERAIVVPSPGANGRSSASATTDADAAAYEAHEPPRDLDADYESRAEALSSPSRPEIARPLAPLARRERRGGALYWALGSAAIAIAAGVAVLAFVLRDAPQTVDNKKVPAAVAEKAPSKIIDRIGVGPTRLSDAAPGAGGSLAPGDAGALATGAGETPLGLSASPASSPAAPTQNASAASMAVAQRAALLVQSPTSSDPQAIATYIGTVVWRLDTVSQGPGKPPALAVRAEIDVPEAQFKASMLFEKNTDDSLPASHTIELRFMPGANSLIGDIKQIDTPQMRKEESPAGDPLSGIPTPITANYFLIGLTKGDPAQSHNIDLMRGAGWFDVPMLLANGKIAKITFEKGVAGQKALTDAFAAWSN